MCLVDNSRTVFDSNSQLSYNVINNFIKNLLNVKYSDCIDLLSKLHTFRAYSIIGFALKGHPNWVLGGFGEEGLRYLVGTP